MVAETFSGHMVRELLVEFDAVACPPVCGLSMRAAEADETVTLIVVDEMT